MKLRAVAPTGGAIEIRLDKEGGPELGRVKIAQGSAWEVVRASVQNVPAGVHDLIIAQAGPNPVAVDWVSFQ